MDCKLFEESISLYIDDQLSEIDKKEFELHLLRCDKCKVKYEKMLKIIKEVRKEEEVQLPENFRSELRQKLLDIETDKKKINWSLFSRIAAGIVIFVLIASIGFLSNIFDTNKLQNDMQYTTMDAAPEESGTSDRSFLDEPASTDIAEFDMDENLAAKSGAEEFTVAIGADDSVATKDIREVRKIIKNAYLSIQVENYDEVFNSIVTFVKNENGYIENTNTSYRVDVNNYKTGLEDNNDREEEIKLKQGNIKIRIPEDKYEYTLNYLREVGEVTNENANEVDLTKSYFDKENIIENLKIQEERLKEILKEAKNLDEILRVEDELRRIRTEIDNHTAVLKDWDDQITLSTINVSLIEVEKLDKNIKKIDDNIWGKAKKGFITTINRLINLIEAMFIGLITILPIIIILIAILIVIYFLAKKFLVKYKNKKE